MRPLTLDDLVPLAEFAGRRRELVTSLRRYVDRYRRVRIGPRLTLLFENRQTLWFRLHEVLRVARLAEPGRVQQELDVYNRLLPGRGRLQAALLIDVTDETRLAEELAPWQALRGEDLPLCVGSRCFPANLVTCRPEDRTLGAAHWVQFVLGADGRRLLADYLQPAHFACLLPAYSHHGEPLSDDVRQSLLDDLDLSERD